MTEYADKLTDEIEAEWIAALRSGEFKQTTGTLEQVLHGTDPLVGYCCLGVLGCVLKAKGLAPETVNRISADSGRDLLPYELAIQRYGMNHNLVTWNDEERADFATIADRIEKKQTDMRYPDAKGTHGTA